MLLFIKFPLVFEEPSFTFFHSYFNICGGWKSGPHHTSQLPCSPVLSQTTTLNPTLWKSVLEWI